jgi:hypothetical protein
MASCASNIHGGARCAAPTADDQRQLLREVLDRPLQDTGRLRIAFGEQRIERLLAQLLARLVAERVLAGFAQRLAPVLDDIAEGALAGAVAEKAFIVLELDVVAVDLDQGEAGGAMRRNSRCGGIGHEPFPANSS